MCQIVYMLLFLICVSLFTNKYLNVQESHVTWKENTELHYLTHFTQVFEEKQQNQYIYIYAVDLLDWLKD